MTEFWHDPMLYAGAAEFYSVGRVAYPRELADRLTDELGLDGAGRLLDVGCGPGSLTLLLADRFEQAVGIDADGEMLREAARLAAAAGVSGVRWRQMYAEDLPGDLGRFRVVTFAQSFHWMDQHQVAKSVRGMLTPGGACVHIHATTHRGIATEASLEFPEPPHEALLELIRRNLDPARQSSLADRAKRSGESDAYRAAGFRGPERITVAGPVVTRTREEVIAAVFSLSSSTPYLFGDRRAAFEFEARQLLDGVSPGGVFSEQMREIAADVWRP
ncbi:MAG TPA: class I SAM-dependent methyltransferase [Propionibacteriaceae bacterium]|nr:class I SAM-dependent methyltransferase [Propionibacteriaceae bacterium]